MTTSDMHMEAFVKIEKGARFIVTICKNKDGKSSKLVVTFLLRGTTIVMVDIL